MHGSSEPAEGTGDAAASFSREEVEAQLARILASAEFFNAPRLAKFLSYLVHAELDAPDKSVTEYDIAYDVFGRKADSFNPAVDSVVRNTARRLRDRLQQYYANGGKSDPLIVELPNRGYEPCFRRRLNPVATNAPEPRKTPPNRWRRILRIGAAAFLLSLCLLLGRSHSPHSQPVVLQNALPARTFSSSTSEGRKLLIIGAPQRYSRLLVTPDGKKLYAVSAPDDQSVTIFRAAADLAVDHVFRLPSPARSVFLSRDGTRIYFGSLLSGVTVVNTATDQPERTIPTRDAVLGLAVTPDNRKLFVAMGNSGFARIDLKTQDRRILSSMAYPFDLGLDRSGRNLYVAYQHGGPGGRWGHDVVEIYDTGTERVSYVIKDLPMVGDRPLFGPRDEVVLLKILDACWSSYYDHVGCSAIAKDGFYLWHPADRRLIGTFPLTKDGGIGGFLPEGNRLFFTGEEPAVWDWGRQQTLEKVRLPESEADGDIAVSGHRVFVCRKAGGIFVFEAETPRCQPPGLGLQNFYSGDGTLDDSFGTGKLTARAEARFAPGRIGQAFDFDGRSAPLATKISADYCPYCRLSWTEAFFVKFRSTVGEMAIMESPTDPTNAGRRILKTAENRIVLETGGGAYPRVDLKSAVSVQSGRWYHVAVVTEGNLKSLFVDGALQEEREVPIAEFHGDHWPAIFGADQHGRRPLNGLLDEILVYSRALTPAEVKSLATSCPAP